MDPDAPPEARPEVLRSILHQAVAVHGTVKLSDDRTEINQKIYFLNYFYKLPLNAKAQNIHIGLRNIQGKKSNAVGNKNG